MWQQQKDHQPNPLNPYRGILLFSFRRARIIRGGLVVGDIDNFNRLSLMRTALKTEEKQNPIAAEGFCDFDENTLKLQRVLVQHIVRKITTNLDLLLFLAEFFSNLSLDFSTKISYCLFVIVRCKSNSNLLIIVWMPS